MLHRYGPSVVLLALALVAPVGGATAQMIRSLPQGRVVSTPQNTPQNGMGFTATPLTGFTSSGIPAPVYNPPINPFTNGVSAPPNATLNGPNAAYGPYFMNAGGNSYGNPYGAPAGNYPVNSFNDPRLNPYLYNPLLSNPYLSNPYLANPNLNNPMFLPNLPNLPNIPNVPFPGQ